MTATLKLTVPAWVAPNTPFVVSWTLTENYVMAYTDDGLTLLPLPAGSGIPAPTVSQGSWTHPGLAASGVITMQETSKVNVSGRVSVRVKAAPVESASGATLNSTAGSIVDALGNVWTLVQSASRGLQFACDGTIDAPTGNVVTGLYWGPTGGAKKLYQVNTLKNWYVNNGAIGNWSQIAGDPRVTPVQPVQPVLPTPISGGFSLGGGNIINGGAVWKGNGVNLAADDQGWFRGLVTAVTDFTNCTPLLKAFPRTKIVRIPCYDILGAMADPASISRYVTALTGKGIVCSIEYHLVGMRTPKGNLNQVVAWYGRWAAYYKNNPLVWFETPNEMEPYQDNDNGANYFATLQGTINAIRAQSNTIIQVMQFYGTISGGLWGQIKGNSWWGQQRNLINNCHIYAGYGYPGQFTGSSQADANSWVAGLMTFYKGVLATADGTNLPVINGEYGDSTDGSNVDNNWQAIVTAGTNVVTTPGLTGSTAWFWNNGGPGPGFQDCLLKGPSYNGVDGLTAFGQTVHDNMI